MPQLGDVVADGRVDREKLAELLSLGAEQEALDFKSSVDFSNPKHRVEHVKDLLALMSLTAGGYLIVGVRNDGTPAVDQKPIVEVHFDQAALHQKIAAYVDAPIDIRSAVHRISAGKGSWNVALIYAGPPPELFPMIVKRHGEYTADGGGQKVVFREGQLIIREGTTTTAVTPRHWPRLLARYTDQVKADTRRDVDALVSRVVSLLEEAERGGGRATPIDLGMDIATFSTAANALIESRSPSRLDAVLADGGRQLRASVANDGSEGAEDSLDRLFAVALAAMLYGTDEQFARTMQVIAEYYYSIPGIPDATSNTSPREQRSAAAWRDVTVRIYVLGAEGVRRAKWSHLRVLTLHPYPVTDSYRYSSWIRHAITSASRANVLDKGDDSSTQTAAIISRALDLAAETPELIPDLAPATPASPTGVDDSLMLDALCEFDVLWCAVAFSVDRQSHDFFPSSAAFEQRHAYPAFERLVRDDQMRRKLFPDLSDAQVAECIDVVADSARRQSQQNPGFNWWDDLPDTVTNWIKNVRPNA
ncbi:hypothetical protein [Microbacterium sp. LWH11-1.2]|uniref:AlbA family DNA-binding domain-containing protein n=1 Tax=Microbacterium sp. LWH11-1.2 TaxID=3135258 RepID=UPI0031396ED4